jgi:hypothetical protein
VETISFYKQEISCEYQSRGWSYKSADSNFATTYVSEGGGYVKQNRWHQCTPDEAEVFQWTAPAATTTSTIDDKFHRYPKTRTEKMRPELLKWFLKILESEEPKSKDISYITLIWKIRDDGHAKGIPNFIKGAIKAFLLEAHRNQGTDSTYCKKYYPIVVLNILKDVQPVYIEESNHLPELD